MLSFRIHSALDDSTGRTPYLVLRTVGQDRVAFDFGPLETDPRMRPTPLAFSMDAFYEVLSGQSLVCDRAEGRVTLVPQGDELVIFCDPHHDRPERAYHVWLSEASLGWNMLGPLLTRNR